MTDAPERIWLGRDERYQGEPWIRLASDFDEEESETQEYIRADLAAPDLMAELVAALRWYGEQSRLARLIHSEGDAGRHAISADGGKRAAAALAKIKEPQHG